MVLKIFQKWWCNFIYFCRCASCDVAQIIDEEGIAVRSGHHNAQVLMNIKCCCNIRAGLHLLPKKKLMF